MRLLVVEDELKMAGLLLRGFRNSGHAADVTRTGEDAVWMAAARRYDAIVLDVMLPGIDGFATLARLREQGRWTPVLMLTARDSVEDLGDQTAPDKAGATEAASSEKTEAAEPSESSSESATESASEVPGTDGHADEPGNANSDHQFQGQE